MTVEEIEIIVTAKIQEALKDLPKLIPAIKNVVRQAKENFEKIDAEPIKKSIQNASTFVKKKVQDLKKSSKNNEITIKVNNKDAKRQITEIEKEIKSLESKISESKLNLQKINSKKSSIEENTSIEENNKFATRLGHNKLTKDSEIKADAILDFNIEKSLNNNSEYKDLIIQSSKLKDNIQQYQNQIENAKSKLIQLSQETEQVATNQNKWGSFFDVLKGKISQTKGQLSGIKQTFGQMPKITQSITSNIKRMSTEVKGGLKQVLKYAGALFSIRGIYRLISSSAQAWLSSQNAQAQQLSANIEYMKYAMGSVFAPVIEYIINLVYQLMKAIQSVVYAFSGINIFAKATASSMKKTAKSAKDTNKSLAGVHDEINNVQTQDNSNSGSEAGSPSLDLSNLDNQMSPFAQKLFDFFKPLKESWDKYGPQIISAFQNAFNGIVQTISAMWNSIESIITNGTIYSIIANILNSIGEIGKAWANAWNNDSNGTEIIQKIADMINNITGAILNLTSSTGFQAFLDGIISAFSGIVQFIEPVVKGFTDMAEKILEIAMSAIGSILQTIGDALQTICQNEVASQVLEAIGGAIAIIVTAIIAWNVAQAILNGLMGLFAVLTSPITLIILGIVAAITAIILIIKNWGAISEWFGELWQKITDKIKEIWENVKQFFVNLWENIINKIKEVWNGIEDFLSNIWNNIKDTVTTVFNAIATFFSNIWNGINTVVSNVINGIKNTISNVLNTIKTIWNNVWNGLKTTVSNVFNGIWNVIKGIINSILGGIEGMSNGVIKGINFVIKALNKLSFDVPDWVPVLGGKKFGFNLGLLNEVSLPRLDKGNVAYSETLAVFGEYAGANNNPEITTPQNILRETFEDVLSKYSSNDSDRPIYLTVNVGNKRLGQVLIDDLRDRKRQTGKDLEALVGG